MNIIKISVAITGCSIAYRVWKSYFKVYTKIQPTPQGLWQSYKNCQGTTDNRFPNKPTAQNAIGLD